MRLIIFNKEIIAGIKQKNRAIASSVFYYKIILNRSRLNSGQAIHAIPTSIGLGSLLILLLQILRLQHCLQTVHPLEVVHLLDLALLEHTLIQLLFSKLH